MATAAGTAGNTAISGDETPVAVGDSKVVEEQSEPEAAKDEQPAKGEQPVVAMSDGEEGGALPSWSEDGRYEGTLLLDTPIAIQTSGDGLYYRFVPADAGTYMFSTSDSDGSVYGALLDGEEGWLLASDDGSARDGNFRIVYELESGKEYFIQVQSSSYEESPSCNLTVTTPDSPDELRVTLKDGAQLIYGDESIGSWETGYSDGGEEFEYFYFWPDSIIDAFEVVAVYGSEELPIGSTDFDKVEYDSTTWATGTSGEVTFAYMGTSAAGQIPVVENPVTSISLQTADGEPYKYRQNIDGCWEEDYFAYGTPSFQDGDMLTVVEGGEEITYVFSVDDYCFVSESAYINGEELLWRSEQAENPWGVGDYEFTLVYKGVECSVPVRVVANLVSGIEFVPANRYELMEGVNGEQLDGWFEYYAPDFEEGDKLVVTEDGNTTTYTLGELALNEDESTWCFIAGSKTISIGDINRYTNQSEETPWTQDGENYVTIEYMGCQAMVPVSIIPNPVAEIKFDPTNTYRLIEGIDGEEVTEWDENDEDVTYFRYYLPLFNDGDKLTVIDSNGNETEYTYVDEYADAEGASGFVSGDLFIDASDVERDSDQSCENPWGLGTHQMQIVYMGRTANADIKVVESSVTSITFTPVESFKLVEEYEGYWEEDDDQGDYFVYHIPSMRPGDTLTVTYADGRTLDYVFSDDEDDFVTEEGEYIDWNYFETSSHQDTQHWTINAENYFTLSYMGKTCLVPVTIVENPVDSIEFTPAQPYQVILGDEDYGEWDTTDDGEDFFYFWEPVFQYGDQLTLKYKDGDTKVYTYQKIESVYEGEVDDTYGAFMADDGETLDPGFMVYQQYQTPWEIGSDNYATLQATARECQVPVTVLALQEISSSGKSVAMGKTVNLGARVTLGAGALSYKSSDTRVVTVDAKGVVKPVKVGTATILITAAANGDYAVTTKTVKVTVTKGANPLTVKAKAVTAKAKKNTTIKTTKAFTGKGAQGKVTYKKANKAGKSKIAVAKNGKITVKKGLKKGTYKVKVKVTAAGNGNYKAGSKTVTVKIKVK